MTEQIESQQPDTTVVVSRVVSHPVKNVWQVLMTTEGMEALLGPGGRLGDKGDRWQADDGTYGVTRSFHPLEQIRFSWHADDEAPRTLVDLHLIAQGDAETLLEIRHEHIGDLDPAVLEKHWEDSLTRIVSSTEA